MNRKVGFWRWVFHQAKDLPKTLAKVLREIVLDPFSEIALAGVVCFSGIMLMPIWFDVFNIPISTSPGLIYLGIMFGFAVLLLTHGVYRDQVK